MRLRAIAFIFILTFLINFVSSATVVQVDSPQPAQGKGFIRSVLTNTYFWLILIGIVVLVCILVAGFFVARWVMNYIKNRNDVFFRIRKERIKLAKIHKTYESTHWMKYTKNTPIRLGKTKNGQLNLSPPIAYHRGDYVTQEGNMIIAMNMEGRRKFFHLLPDTDILIIPNKEKAQIEQRDINGKRVILTIDNIPTAKQIVQFNRNEIIIHAEAISKVGLFFLPVLKDANGKILDLTLPIYSSLKDAIISDYLYEISTEFTKLSKEAMGINPNIRAYQKTNDNNQSVDLNNQQ